MGLGVIPIQWLQQSLAASPSSGWNRGDMLEIRNTKGVKDTRDYQLRVCNLCPSSPPPPPRQTFTSAQPCLMLPDLSWYSVAEQRSTLCSGPLSRCDDEQCTLFHWEAEDSSLFLPSHPLMFHNEKNPIFCLCFMSFYSMLGCFFFFFLLLSFLQPHSTIWI